jgi:hypothetical protein
MIRKLLQRRKLKIAKHNLARTIKEMNNTQKHSDNIGNRLIYLGLANQYKSEIKELEKELK